jgi:hypothetical protein
MSLPRFATRTTYKPRTTRNQPPTAEAISAWEQGRGQLQALPAVPSGQSKTVLGGRSLSRGRHGRVVDAEGQEVVAPADEDAAIATFLEVHPRCEGSGELIKTFLDTAATAQLNGIDLKSLITAGEFEHIIPETFARVSSSRSRVAHYALAQHTVGPRSPKQLPSMMWDLLSQACDKRGAEGIQDLIRVIQYVYEGELGQKIENAPVRVDSEMIEEYYGPEQLDAKDDAIANFIAEHGMCDQNPEVYRNFLYLVDHLPSAGVLEAVLRQLGLAGVIPRTKGLKSGTRVGTLDILEGPAVGGTRGKARDKVKYTLLWKILETQCNNLPAINAALEEGVLGPEVPIKA